MSDMKCPFCQQELVDCGTILNGPRNLGCANCGLSGDSKLFEELERTRKALDVAVDALKLFCGEDVSYYSQSKIDARDARTALEQINNIDKGEQNET